MNAGKIIRTSLATALSATVALAPTYVSAQVEPADAPTLRITSGGGAQSASLVLPFGKSAIIDLPADARDVLISNPQIADATIRVFAVFAVLRVLVAMAFLVIIVGVVTSERTTRRHSRRTAPRSTAST